MVRMADRADDRRIASFVDARIPRMSSIDSEMFCDMSDRAEGVTSGSRSLRRRRAPDSIYTAGQTMPIYEMTSHTFLSLDLSIVNMTLAKSTAEIVSNASARAH